MTRASVRRSASRSLLAALALSLAACAAIASPPGEPRLHPLQQAVLARPVSPEAAAGRPATLQDLQAVREWFAPGELEALLHVVNRRAAARGEDTVPHCIPLCGSPVTHP